MPRLPRLARWRSVRGVLRRGRFVAAVIATVAADGRHETGTAHLTAIARWLLSHADVRGLPATASCP